MFLDKYNMQQAYLLVETSGESHNVVGTYPTRLKAEDAALEKAPYTFMKWEAECPYIIGSNPYGKLGIQYPTYSIHKVVD